MRPQLFLLHFAGGNCYSYEFLKSSLKEFDVIVPELPGRGRRLGENLLTDFDLAAGDMYRQITQQLRSSSFFLYGHSMGAYLALRITRMLQKAGHRPAYLVVSGNAGPGTGDDKKRYLMAHDDFVNELRKLGGVPEELLENEELFKYFEPILKADFEVSEKNNLAGEPAVDIPLYAMMGSEETNAGKIANWAFYTSSLFTYQVLDGGHFFIYKNAERIADIIRECHKSVTYYQLH